MELCLGTVQFGMDYGIRGQKKPPREDAIRCLDYATQNGIMSIDTAIAYGDAEEVVGDFMRLRTCNRDELHICSKFKPNLLDGIPLNDYEKVIENQLEKQLKTLNTEYLDVYMFHSSRYAFDDEKLYALNRMKEKGLVRHVGVSVYEVEEANACLKSPYVGYIQVPYSVFDHRMKNGGVFDSTIRGGCIIDSRSAFIQGLITMEEKRIPKNLESARPIVAKVKSLCNENGISPVHLAIQYVKSEESISHLVFGVDSLEQLKEDIESFYDDLSSDFLEVVGKEFDELDAEIVMPSLWKK